jgi:hypothetical protein
LPRPALSRSDGCRGKGLSGCGPSPSLGLDSPRRMAPRPDAQRAPSMREQVTSFNGAQARRAERSCPRRCTPASLPPAECAQIPAARRFHRGASRDDLRLRKSYPVNEQNECRKLLPQEQQCHAIISILHANGSRMSAIARAAAGSVSSQLHRARTRLRNPNPHPTLIHQSLQTVE